MVGKRRFLLLCCISAILVLLIAQIPARAADLEDSAPLLCAFTRSMDCDSEQGCSDTALESLNLPPFFKVDFKDKLITNVEALGGRTAPRRTSIQNLRRMDGVIILQGIELRAWSMLISEKTGKMTLTASDSDEAFVLFGTCRNF